MKKVDASLDEIKNYFENSTKSNEETLREIIGDNYERIYYDRLGYYEGAYIFYTRYGYAVIIFRNVSSDNIADASLPRMAMLGGSTTFVENKIKEWNKRIKIIERILKGGKTNYPMKASLYELKSVHDPTRANRYYDSVFDVSERILKKHEDGIGYLLQTIKGGTALLPIKEIENGMERINSKKIRFIHGSDHPYFKSVIEDYKRQILIFEDVLKKQRLKRLVNGLI